MDPQQRRELLGEQFPGEGRNDFAAEADDDRSVTSVNLTQDFMGSQEQEGESKRVEDGESSADWLKSHGLQSCGLTLSHFLSSCSSNQTLVEGGGSARQPEVSAVAPSDFESRLYRAIQMFHNRMQWLAEGSQKSFGLVRGSNVGVLVDTSDLSCSMDRLWDLQQSLLGLLEEQLSYKKQLFLLSFGTDVSPLWDKPRQMNPSRLREARDWVLRLAPSGGCNLLAALSSALTHPELDVLLLILGSRPDQSRDVIMEYLAQGMLGRVLSVHAVAYRCSCAVAVANVKNVTEATGGRYHIFSTASGVVDSSTDLDQLWGEIKAARVVLAHVGAMRQGAGRAPGLSGTADLPLSAGVAKLCVSDSALPTQCGVAALDIRAPGHLACTSAQWLTTHSLKALSLDLYELLAPNAYAPLEEFVPVLGRTVRSTIHQRAMVPFEWHDGTVRSVHVDLPSLRRYQKRLLRAMCELQARMEWLRSAGSRHMWGAVSEPRVHILVELSGMSAPYWPHIRHSLRMLLEEQLADTHMFNVTVFSTEIQPWKEQMVPTSRENLQAVWQWLQGKECAGGRNTLSALRFALEVDLQECSDPSLGLYLLTCGAPDQRPEVLSAYLSERCRGASRLHVCLFTGTVPPLCPPPLYGTSRAQTAVALRDLAHTANGRFHWITETGMQESDDVSALIGEMERAADYWHMCSLLVESWTQRSVSRAPEPGTSQCSGGPARGNLPGGRRESLPPPRHTALTLARQLGKEKPVPQRTAAWRPNSASASIPAGAVFKTYPKPTGVCKTITTLKLPRAEEVCSTKQEELVPALHKTVSAKYCSSFPRVPVNGRVWHLQMTPAELSQYLTQTERVVQRYTQRMRWLLSGSRRVLGLVLEVAVCVLLDVSGSMAPWLPEMRSSVTALIWEQLHGRAVSFTLVAFCEAVLVWQPGLVQATQESCRDAEQWLTQLTTHGGSALLAGLQTACGMADGLGLYVISDGRCDASHSRVLQEAKRMTAGRRITVHAVSVNGQDGAANEFLRKLAHATGGRFHCAPGDADALVATETLGDGSGDGEDMALPASQSDDIKRLAREIDKVRAIQKQAKTFREIILGKKNPEAI